ncbi:hypothetical protein [Tsukamurella pseudospumae]|uniref:Uncharacterized protein n=1 Tax=Tsukamurella pseudospumae TaxID=239498 RepID=A0A137Z801_9ACTN|nr:hypothetical protein [Tsukamurella pseudospumae]KXO94316.1 hypothetical protein AXK61_23865 [Tsukamurella pseudospumae]
MIVLAMALPAALAMCGAIYLTASDDDSDELPRRRIRYWQCCLLCCVFVPLAVVAAKPDVDVGALAAVGALVAIGFVINAVARTRYAALPWTTRSTGEAATAISAQTLRADRGDTAADPDSEQNVPWRTSRPSRSRAILLCILTAGLITLSAVAATSLMGPARTAAALTCAAFCFLAAASTPGAVRKYEHPGVHSPRLENRVFHCWPGATFTARIVPSVTLASLSIAAVLVGASSSAAPAGLASSRGVALVWYAIGAIGLATALFLTLTPRSASQWTEISVDDRGVIIVSSRRTITVDWLSTVDLRALPTASYEIRPAAEIAITMVDGSEVSCPLGRARVDPTIIWSALTSSRNRALGH